MGKKLGDKIGGDYNQEKNMEKHRRATRKAEAALGKKIERLIYVWSRKLNGKKYYEQDFIF